MRVTPRQRICTVYVAGSARVRYLLDLAHHFFDLNQTACRVGGIRPRHLGQGGPPWGRGCFQLKIEPQLTAFFDFLLRLTSDEALPAPPTDDVPPTEPVLHAWANRTATRSAIEMLAGVEPLSGVMSIRSESVITVATGDIVMCGGPECQRVQNASRDCCLCYRSH